MGPGTVTLFPFTLHEACRHLLHGVPLETCRIHQMRCSSSTVGRAQYKRSLLARCTARVLFQHVDGAERPVQLRVCGLVAGIYLPQQVGHKAQRSMANESSKYEKQAELAKTR